MGSRSRNSKRGLEGDEADSASTKHLRTDDGNLYKVHHSKKLGPVLDVLDRVRQLLKGVESIEVPHIVVVGDQSHGKSSVLEAICGIELPRGQNTVTRLPIIIQMRSSETDGEMFLELTYKKNGAEEQKHTLATLHELPAAIQAATDELAGPGEEIVNCPITLTIRTPNSPNLTLIDLPGITRLLRGVDDIEKRVTDLIEEYIKSDSSIILNVVQATVDFSTCACFKLSQKHDRDGRRTLGVITKVDTLNEPNVIVKKLLPTKDDRDVYLELGFVAVKLRSQQQLDEGVPHSEALRLEQEFFRSHPELKGLPPGHTGVPALVDRLLDIQLTTTRTAIPNIKQAVDTELKAVAKQLKALDGLVTHESDALMLFQLRTNEIQRHLGKLIDLKYDEVPGMGFSAKETAGLRVPPHVQDSIDNYELSLWSEEGIGEKSFFFGKECRARVQAALKDVRGHSLPNFLSDAVFRDLYLEVVHGKLLAPSLELLREVREYMEWVLFQLAAFVLADQNRLMAPVCEEIRELMDAQQEIAVDYVSKYIDTQKIVFTQNHYYMDTVTKIEADVAARRAFRVVNKPPTPKAPGAPAWGAQGFQFGVAAPPAQGNVPPAGAAAAPQATPGNPSTPIAKPPGLSSASKEVVTDDIVEELAGGVSNDEQAVVKMQVSLAAFTKVAMKRVCDDVPLAARLFLVEQVQERVANHLSKAFLGSDGGGGAARLLALMTDPRKVQQLQSARALQAKLQAARAELQRI